MDSRGDARCSADAMTTRTLPQPRRPRYAGIAQPSISVCTASGAIDPALREATIILTGVIVFARYFRGQLSSVNQCDLLLEPEKRRPMNALRIPAGFTMMQLKA